MKTEARFLLKALGYGLLAALVIILLRPVVEVLTGISMFVVSVFFLPVALLVLGWFVMSVWGKAYLRAWHIRRLRNARYLREAMERGRTEE